jgi:hypothetical protein
MDAAMSAFLIVIDVLLAALILRYAVPQLDGVTVLLMGAFGLIVAWWKLERG